MKPLLFNSTTKASSVNICLSMEANFLRKIFFFNTKVSTSLPPPIGLLFSNCTSASVQHALNANRSNTPIHLKSHFAQLLTLFFILFLSLILPQTICAQDVITFTADNNQGYPIEYTVTGSTEHTVAVKSFPYTETGTNIDLTLPETVNHEGIDYTLTAIGAKAFNQNTDLRSVICPQTIVSIGRLAFGGCTNMVTITLPNRLESIADYAFYQCTKLQSVTIPEGITHIGLATFYQCNSLQNVTLPSTLQTIGQNAFYQCDFTAIDVPQSVTSIGDAAFAECRQLSSLTLREGLTAIGKSAFIHCTSLQQVQLPQSLTTMGTAAFNESGLTSINIPAKVKTIEEATFMDCKSLTSVTLPETLETIGKRAFSGCSSLTAFHCPQSLKNIGNSAFDECTNLISITMPDRLETIGNQAFYQCYKLQSIRIPEGVKSLSEYCLGECTSLTEITLPSTLQSIEYGAFYKCSVLPSIRIPEGVKSLLEFCFGECTSLAEVTLPSTLQKVGYAAFQLCTDLRELILPQSLTTIDGYAFQQSGLTHISIPAGVTEIGEGICWKCPDLQRVEIAEGVKVIGERAFQECDKLKTDIHLPESMTHLGDYAFVASGITGINIPSGVKNIPQQLCAGCANLKKVDIAEGVTSLGYAAFYNCPSVSSLILPSTLTSIDDWALARMGGLRYLIVLGENTPVPTSRSTILSYSYPNIIVPNATYGDWNYTENSRTRGSILSQNSDVTVAGITALFENEYNSPYLGIQRPFLVGQWNSLCLPFDITTNNLKATFGSDTQLAFFDENVGKNKDIGFNTFTGETATIPAGTPFLIKPMQEKNTETGLYQVATHAIFAFNNNRPTLVETALTKHNDGNVWTFKGALKPTQLVAETDYFFGTDNKIYRPSATQNNPIKAFRAYMSYDTNSINEAPQAKYTITVDGITTAIDTPKVLPFTPKGIYNLQGVYVGDDLNALPKGIYIIEGKKVMK